MQYNTNSGDNALAQANVVTLSGFNWRVDTSLDYTPVIDSIETPSPAGPGKEIDFKRGETQVVQSSSVGLGLPLEVIEEVDGGSVGKHVAAVQSSPDEVFQEKKFCNRCGFLVKVFGHEKRCRTPTNIPYRVKQFAWIGDCIWEKFVRSWIVAGGREFQEASLYVTNERLAQAYDEVAFMIDLGCRITHDASLHSKATYVEAAMALSGVVRLYMTTFFRMNIGVYQPNLWRSELVMRPDDDTIRIQPEFDGYCYLHLVPRHAWNATAKSWCAYPFWAQIKQSALSSMTVRLYLKVVSGVAHISNVELPGMTQYDGDWRNIPFDDHIRVGGGKTENLTSLFETNSIDSEWSDATKRKFGYIERELLRAKSHGKTALVTERCLEKLLKLFEKPGTETDASMARSGLNQVYNALISAMQLVERDVSYIATSGVLAFVKTSDL